MSNQQNRHEAKANIVVAYNALVGEPGLTYTEQLERLAIAAKALAEAQKAIGYAMNHVITENAKAEAEVVKAAETLLTDAAF